MINKILFLILNFTMICNIAGALSTDTMTYGAFGKIIIYKPSVAPTTVILFISGDAGWNKDAENIAENISKTGALVAGIDYKHFVKNMIKRKSAAIYPAGDLEELSFRLQRKFKMKKYIKPILAGHSSGATLVYGALVQAPANTFKGAVAMGFCPDIQITKPLAKGNGLTYHVLKESKSYYLDPCVTLTAMFIVLGGNKDQVCPVTNLSQYLEGMKYAEIIPLPKVGHGFAVGSKWQPQFVEAIKKIKETPTYAEQNAAQNKFTQNMTSVLSADDISLSLLPSIKNDTLPIALVISGDGGWTSFDQSFSRILADNGIPVVGLDAQKYFWDKKSPEGTAQDVVKAVQYFMTLWNRKSFILIGYSFGACVVPFIAEKLPEQLKSNLKGVFSLSPDEKGDFEIHITDMLSLGGANEQYDVLAEMKRIKEFHPVCIFGEEEESDTRIHFAETGAKIFTLPGTHHYDNNFTALAGVIRKCLLIK